MELFLIDEGHDFDIQHPIHIHGYSPYIIAMERHATKPERIFPVGRKYFICGKYFIWNNKLDNPQFVFSFYIKIVYYEHTFPYKSI